MPYWKAMEIIATGGLRAVDYNEATTWGDGDFSRRPIFEEAACAVADWERDHLPALTGAERCLYELRAAGLTYRELGQLYGRAYKTIGNRLKKIGDKLKKSYPKITQKGQKTGT